jgi:hypothetical protein
LVGEFDLVLSQHEIVRGVPPTADLRLYPDNLIWVMPA